MQWERAVEFWEDGQRKALRRCQVGKWMKLSTGLAVRWVKTVQVRWIWEREVYEDYLQAGVCVCVWISQAILLSWDMWFLVLRVMWPSASYCRSMPFQLLKPTCSTFVNHHESLRKAAAGPCILSLPSDPSRQPHGLDPWLCPLTVLWDVISFCILDFMPWMVVRGPWP